MKEYIERDALIQQMADNFRQGVFEGCDCGEYRIAEDTILEAPAADAVEVVRCKDCKNAKRHEVFPYSRRCRIEDYRLPHRADHFCSYGERRSDP